MTSPSPLATFLSYTDATLASGYTAANGQAVVNYLIGLYESQLIDSSFYTTLGTQNNIELTPKTYGTRNIPVPFGGQIQASSFVYGLLSDANAEVRGYSVNEGDVNVCAKAAFMYCFSSARIYVLMFRALSGKN